MNNDNNIIIGVITVTVVFTLFSVFMIISFIASRRNKEKHRQEMEASKKEYEQHLLQVQVEVQESTYRHIAKELHDNVGQLLSTTKMLMGITELKLGHAPETLVNASTTLGKAIQEIRLLSRSLDKDWLAQFNFLENLQGEVDRINGSEVIKAAVDCHTAIALKPEEQIILFRIVQEAMQNAVRHAQPSTLNVIINDGQQLEVKVINDGKPLPPDFHGMGTANMKHRARLFGGTVQWQSAPQETTVTICLPLNHAHEN